VTAVDSNSAGRRAKREELPQQDRRSCKICLAQAVLFLQAIGPAVLQVLALSLYTLWQHHSHHSRSRTPKGLSSFLSRIVTADETWVHSEQETKKQFWNGTVSGQGHGQSVVRVKE
jgi:arginyl-tRNA--protein-N-Asp/Glu arginylyltransferase